MIRLEPIADADLSLVELRGTCGKLYPHCKVHGAMNQLTKEGIWRCVTSYDYRDVTPPELKAKGKKFPLQLIENACKAGCVFVRDER